VAGQTGNPLQEKGTVEVMFLYPEEVRDNEIRRRIRKLRYVVYECGCRIFNVSIVPWKCDLHEEEVRMTGPMYTPEGESYFINPRYIC